MAVLASVTHGSPRRATEGAPVKELAEVFGYSL